MCIRDRPTRCSTPASASRASWRRLMPSWTAWAVVSRPHCPAAMWDARATTFVIMLTLYHSVDTNGVMYPQRVNLCIRILYPIYDTESVCDQDRGRVDALHHHPPVPSADLRAHLLLFWMSELLCTSAAIQQEPCS